MINVMVADDHALIQESITSLLDREAAINVVASATNIKQLRKKLSKVDIDILILDISFGEDSGLAILPYLHDHYPKLSTIILTMHNNPAYLKHALKHNVAGYVLKDDSYLHLVQAIRVVYNGGKYISQVLTSNLVDVVSDQASKANKSDLDILTAREKQVITLAAKSYTNKQIGDKLKISPRTVEVHRHRIYKKIRISDTAALVRFALQTGLVD